MLSEAREKQIRMLLTEGKLSQREVSELTGTSRATVNAIARGRRSVSLQSGNDTAACFAPKQRPRRCPGCGGMVYLPCHLCRIRRYVLANGANRVRTCVGAGCGIDQA
ncbi:MAG: hypothetical protein DCC68_05585 [Planctomycetota bacterium]|nr:MAG: hypothetical protein DCC68_05585 [Planctomycetota bacterium]